ncbi:uncharacterized protein LOC123958104 [Micropterus dolomieu]|uniref:uncharacterized protein LOC123958104 n=1 Tax=Micropterus dolomieu TaxID=147949 RepID=UPI001E8DE519|nr:uncharacterized protein LOC123958104 [Micropterus dolomieu]
MLRVGRCTDDQSFDTKTVGVGQNVTLICTLQTSRDIETFFWVKVVAGILPEVLGRAFSFNDDVTGISGITLKKEPGRFFLHITKTKLRDMAFYYCLKSHRFNITFLKGTFLRIKGPEHDITTITQDFLSDPVRPGDSVTLQCSVLSDSENKTCPEEDSVYWFRVGSDESHPRLIYVQRKSGDECETSPEARSPQSCVYSLFGANISSTESGTYYCAVTACGKIIFGNGSKLDIEDVSSCDSQKDNTIVLLLCAALAISLIVIAFLVYAIWKKSCDCCNAVVASQTNAATASSDQQSQRRNEDSLIYSTAIFTKRKAGKVGRRHATANEETIYTDVRAFVID